MPVVVPAVRVMPVSVPIVSVGAVVGWPVTVSL